MTRRCELYRHFDKTGRLLYVGIANNTVSRLAQHKDYGAEWYDQIVRIEIERFPSRTEAREAEKRAIAEEDPLFNRAVESRAPKTLRVRQLEEEKQPLIDECHAKGIKIRINWTKEMLQKAIENAPKGGKYPFYDDPEEIRRIQDSWRVGIYTNSN